jgi:drug/metabolite transporter (DMT)-like permease
MPLPDLLRIAGLVFAAVTLIVTGDTAGKLLTANGAAPLFVAWSRFALGALILLPLSGVTHAELRYFASWQVLLRAVVIAAAISCILTALKTEPMANVFGAFFVGPVVAFVLAAIVLKERPSVKRSALMALGFLGVMLVVKPGFGFTAGMGFALASGTLYGGFLVLTRSIARNYRPRFLLISQLLTGAVLLAPAGLSAQMPDMGAGVLLLVLLSALGSAAGNYMLVVANRRAEASLIAPLVYTQLISAAGIGALVFGDWPDAISSTGLVLIALSGFGSLAVRQPSADAGQKAA